MDTRIKLNELKKLWGLRTDNDLAEYLGISKFTIDNWVKRNKISNEWILRIGQMADTYYGQNVTITTKWDFKDNF